MTAERPKEGGNDVVPPYGIVASVKLPALLLWSGLAIGWLLPSVGCQVEYAGMTLPSGKYMHDDVQYFAPGPDFPWANTQAATQRARMQSMGMEAPPGGTGPLLVPPAQGAINPLQNQMGRPTDINSSPLTNEPPVPDMDAGGAGVPAGPGGVVPGGVAPAAGASSPRPRRGATGRPPRSSGRGGHPSRACRRPVTTVGEDLISRHWTVSRLRDRTLEPIRPDIDASPDPFAVRGASLRSGRARAGTTGDESRTRRAPHDESEAFSPDRAD